MQKQTDKIKSSQSVLTIMVGFLVIFLITGWQWAVITSLLVGLAAVFSSWLAEKIHWIWMKIAGLLGLIIPKILLTLVYYFVLLPVALVSRMFRKDPPVILENNKNSMFRNMHKTFGKEDFKKPW